MRHTKPFFILAPMNDVTDTVFRQIVAECAKPDLFITEFVNVDGLQSPGRKHLLHKLKFSPKEQPIVAQLWGLKPENFYKTTKELVGMGFSGVDLNFGCPVKTVIKNGACAALINNRQLAGEIINATRAGAGRDFPVSVKTRVGFTTVDLSWIEFLLSKKLDLLSIHGRTAQQKSKVSANWDLVGQAREMRDAMFPAKPRLLHADGMQGADEQRTEPYKQYGEGVAQSATPQSAASISDAVGSADRQAGAMQELRTLIVGNGDVISRQQGLELADKYKLDGIMIGRGIFNDPFIFSKDGTWKSGQGPWANYTKQQKIDLYRKHVELFARTWTNGERRIETLNKFCKIYISGFDGAKELREQLIKARTTEKLLSVLN